MVSNARQVCISQLGSWTLTQLAGALEGDEGLRAVLVQLNVLNESERGKYVAVLNGILTQLVSSKRDSNPSIACIPPWTMTPSSRPSPLTNSTNWHKGSYNPLKPN